MKTKQYTVATIDGEVLTIIEVWCGGVLVSYHEEINGVVYAEVA